MQPGTSMVAKRWANDTGRAWQRVARWAIRGRDATSAILSTNTDARRAVSRSDGAPVGGANRDYRYVKNFIQEVVQV